MAHQGRHSASLYDRVDNLLCAIGNHQIRLSKGAVARIGAAGVRLGEGRLPFFASSVRTWVARLAAARSARRHEEAQRRRTSTCVRTSRASAAWEWRQQISGGAAEPESSSSLSSSAPALPSEDAAAAAAAAMAAAAASSSNFRFCPLRRGRWGCCFCCSASIRAVDGGGESVSEVEEEEKAEGKSMRPAR